MITRVLKVGVMSRNDYRKRTIDIAKGEYTPRKDEPKVWFESLKSMAQVLSSENQELLKIILEKKPKSLSELEVFSGRRKANLSRTLKTLQRYGIVDLENVQRRIVPKVKATDFKVEFGLHYSMSLRT
jgi:predicted transcriptional regulator